MDVSSKALSFSNSNSVFKLNFKNASYGHHFGLYSRAKFLGVYIEPSLMFNSNSANYALEEYSEVGVFDKVLTERYYDIDVPVLVGMKFLLARVYAGPVAHMHIAKTSDLVNISGYAEKINSASYGYQAGVGLDLFKLRLDLTYEGNLSRFGNHITIAGKPYAFDNGASRILATVGYKF